MTFWEGEKNKKPDDPGAFDPDLVAPEWGWFWESFQRGGGGVWPFWERAAETRNLLELGALDSGGDLAPAEAGHVWGSNAFGSGIHFDHTFGPDHSLTITSPNPGFWHSAVTNHTLLCVCDLDNDLGGGCLYDYGASSNGFVVGYRDGSNAIIFAVKKSGALLEIASTTLFNTPSQLVIAARLQGDAMTLFVNGIKEATGTRTGTFGAPGDNPGIGSVTNVAAVTNLQEWGGTINFVAASHVALNDAQIFQWSRDPAGHAEEADEVGAVIGLPAVAAGNPYYAYAQQ